MLTKKKKKKIQGLKECSHLVLMMEESHLLL